MFLTLDATSYSYCTREADPEDNWDRGNSGTDWTIGGISLGARDSERSLPADFDVQVGDKVFVVYAVYSTGDTFGHDEGAYLEVLSFHKNREIAERNLAAAEGRTRRDRSQLVLEFDSGGKVERYCPWDGYFESLDYARLEEHVVSR
jgi:hypothetical protein